MKRNHPTLEEWLNWVHDRLGDHPATEMENHLRECPRCVDSFPMLRRVRSANAAPGWTDAPTAVLDAVTRPRPMPSPPPRPARLHTMHWRPADVRGKKLVAAAEPGSLNAVLASAEVSIVANAPKDDPFWEIEGRIWLREREEEHVDIVLLQDDHVIAHRQVADAEFFRIREILPPGWELEVHLPDRNTLKLADESS